jgi:hypothetical protein
MNRGSLVALMLAMNSLAVAEKAALADAGAFEVGESWSALPGIVRVPIGGRTERLGWGGAATGGYGFTESVVAAADKSHRVFGSLAGSLRATDWFAVALRIDGRYDWHTNVPGGNGGGGVGQPNLIFRAGADADAWRLGAQLGVGFPGREAPSVTLAATSPELSLLGAYAPASGPVALASRVGFRLDRSAETVSDPDRLNAADRLSLGVSDTNELLLGAGVTAPAAPGVEILAEWTWDVRVPSKGVSAAQSPMRLDAGARISTSDTLALQLVVEVSPSSRPGVGAGTPLAVVEPRVSVFAGITLRPPLPTPALPSPSTQEPAREPRATAVTGRIVGRLSDEGGRPIAGAKVHIGRPDAGADVATDAEGKFEQGALAAGKIEVKAVAEGYREEARTVEVGAGQSAQVEMQLERSLPLGQIRGLARSFAGAPIKATVRIEPIGKEVVVGDGGRFEIDVPPGEYDVIVKAPGYADQHRHVRVESNGVVVIDLDMRTRR